MAIYNFGLVVDDVLNDLPVDSTQIGANSTPVSTGKIEEWINDRSAMAIGMLSRAGISNVEELDDTTQRQVRIYIKSSVVADAMDKMAMSTQSGYGRYREKAATAREVLTNAQLLKRRVGRMRSNVDTDKTPRRDFTGDYQF